MTIKLMVFVCLVHTFICAENAGTANKDHNNEILECGPLDPVSVASTGDSHNASHMVILGMKMRDNEIKWVCSGIPITKYFIMTVAHCLTSPSGQVEKIRVSHGTSAAQNISVEKLYVHPDYKPPVRYNDIALIKLKNPVSFGTYLKQGCLYPEKELQNDPTFIETSWSYFSEPIDDKLRFTSTELDEISTEECTEKATKGGPVRGLPSGIIKDQYACFKELGTACRDYTRSGGGALTPKNGVTENNKVTILGLSSFGQLNCGLNVFVRVHPYISWIKETVNKEERINDQPIWS